ncbi:TetR/AcrR family transcriptional regulator [Paenibacillus athensensis]|nr:TetR/AcrR family transcriptional regulator [Paenibacillus athensensis]MCD1258575.1 TetR/AcrR family transcriptional regulator [Paenibacillus athensensis]
MSDLDQREGGKARQFGRRRRGDEKEQVRRLIVETAGELFVELGYNAFSMRKLAERLQYSPATLYLYFRDKDALLFTIVDEALLIFRNRLTQASEGISDPWARLERLGETYLAFGLQHPAYYQLMFTWRIDYLLGSRQEEELPRIHVLQVLVDVVAEAMEQGAMQSGDPGVYSDYLWATMHGIVTLAIQMPMFDEARVGQLAAHTREMIRAALKKS